MSVDAIIRMLGHGEPDKQVAAAIVLTELGVKNAATLKGLAALLDSDVPVVQRRALEGLARLAPKTALPRVVRLAGSRDRDVAEAAARTLAAAGESAVPLIRERLTHAGQDEQRALNAVLARLGGKQAFSALLGRLSTSDAEAARAVALEVRHYVKDSDEKTRRAYFTELQRFLQLKTTRASPTALAAGLKIVGYLELPGTQRVLLEFVTRKGDAVVREEAVAALRFVPGTQKEKAKAAAVLLRLATTDATSLGRAAFFTLANVELSPAMLKKVAALARHKDVERARLTLEFLGRLEAKEAQAALVDVVSKGERTQAELAATALKGKATVAKALLRALEQARAPEKVVLLARLVRDAAAGLGAKDRAALARLAVGRFVAGGSGWDAALATVRELDPTATAEELRKSVAKLTKARKHEAAVALLGSLVRGTGATDDDRFRLAALELLHGRHDTHPAARERDSALKTFDQLSRHGFDVAKALLRERSLDNEALYYVGFHFAEADHPLGEELLSEVAKRAGRTKIGKMARNKLELVARQG